MADPVDADADDVILYDRIRALQLESPAPVPVLVALDGRSGVGKSTLASQVATEIGAGALVIDGDDFYCGGGDAYWDALGPAEKVDLVIDWRRQRTLLESLRRGEPATWRPYDRTRTTGASPRRSRRARPASSSSMAPTAPVRSWRTCSACGGCCTLPATSGGRGSCSGRGAHYRAEWEARWSEAEDLYFDQLMPPSAFDLVLDGSGSRR